MKKIRIVTVFSLLLAGGMVPEAPAAARPAKGVLVAPVVELKGSFPGPKVRHDMTTAQIERLRTNKEPKGWHNPGLTVSEHVLNTRYELAMEQARPGAPYRVRVDHLTVEFTYTVLEVYVASEYGAGTCEYREILKHEMEHVAIHAATYRKYRRLLKTRLETAGVLPTKQKPIVAKSAAQAQARVDKIVQGITRPISDAFARELVLGHARIDTPANYKAIQGRCKGWAGK